MRHRIHYFNRCISKINLMINKLLSLLIATFLFSSLNAQTVTMRLDGNLASGDVGDTITVTAFGIRTMVLAKFSFPLSFDSTNLEFVGSENPVDAFLDVDDSEAASGELGISWEDPNRIGFNSFRTEFIDLKFRIKGDCRKRDSIVYRGDVVPFETFRVDDGNLVMVNTEYLATVVRTECEGVGSLTVEDKTIGLADEMVSVDIRARGIVDAVSIFYRLSYDTTKLEYIDYDNNIGSSVEVNAVGDKLIYIFEDGRLENNSFNDSVIVSFIFRSRLDCSEQTPIIFDSLGDTRASVVYILDGDPLQEYPAIANGTVNLSCKPIVDFSTTDIDCFGENTGSILLDVSSGTPPYFFTWADDPTILTEDRINIPAGSYDVTVSDVNGEETIVSGIVVEQNSEIEGALNFDGDCETGIVSLSLTASGGIGPYIITWSNDETGPNIAVTPPVDLAVTIADNLDCEKIFRDISVEEIPELEVDPQVTNVTCNGDEDGSIVVNVVSGTAPFEYNWSGPNNFNSTMDSIENLPPGEYSLDLVDANNCSTIIPITIQEPEILTVRIETQSTTGSMNNGSATASVTGGVPDYNFAWSCTESTTNEATGLAPGNCCVTITDEGGCEIIECFDIQMGTNISEFEGLQSFEAYPIPLDDLLRMQVSFLSARTVEIELVNILGVTMDKMEYENISTLDNQILVSHLKPGVYFLKLTDNQDNQLIKKMIKK